MRTIASALLATLAAAMVAVAGTLAAEFVAMPVSFRAGLSSLPTLSALALGYAACIGLPAAWFYTRGGGSGRRTFAWLGMAAGLLPSAVIAFVAGLFATGSGAWSGVLFFLVVGAVVGWLSGLAFGGVLQLTAPKKSMWVGNASRLG